MQSTYPLFHLLSLSPSLSRRIHHTCCGQPCVRVRAVVDLPAIEIIQIWRCPAHLKALSFAAFRWRFLSHFSERSNARDKRNTAFLHGRWGLLVAEIEMINGRSEFFCSLSDKSEYKRPGPARPDPTRPGPRARF